MIHHVSVGTNDLQKSRKFYDPVMEVLGLRALSSDDDSIDYGVGETIFSVETPVDGETATAGNGVHIAFHAQDHEMVQKFYNVALASGGKSDGEPGLRPKYDANYYGAFVYDPDGNKIEAVTFLSK